MRIFSFPGYPAFAAILISFSLALPVAADEATDALLSELKTADEPRARQIERELERTWGLSGSTSIDLIYRRGKDAMEEENWRRAIEHFSAVTDHAPEFAEGWHARATAFWRQGQLGLALDDLGRALALNPENWDALFGMGVLFQELKDYARAEQAFRMALDINPHHERAQTGLKQIGRFGVGQDL
jgi:tetratricopeptide (TPR) repeat protein